ncbi:MAG: cob(I)yrinic acid a,c-diamide adenosyltransferase [Anaerolineae bacterium]|jgi:cob(I)alamin adenosyltransferase
MPRLYTGTGDDGYTGLLGEGRVPKHHARPEAYGAVDEASAALGWARAKARYERSKSICEQVQRDLYHLMAELAAVGKHASAFGHLSQARVEWLERQIDDLAEGIEVPNDFVIFGDTQAGAAMDLARTVVRRAERRVSQLQHEGEIENPHLLRYLNRLSSLCFVLALWEEFGRREGSPRLAKSDRP